MDVTVVCVGRGVSRRRCIALERNKDGRRLNLRTDDEPFFKIEIYISIEQDSRYSTERSIVF